MYPEPALTKPLTLYTAKIVVGGKEVGTKTGNDLNKLLDRCLYNLPRPHFVDFYYNPTGKAVAGWGSKSDKMMATPHGPKGYFESLNL